MGMLVNSEGSKTTTVTDDGGGTRRIRGLEEGDSDDRGVKFCRCG